MSEPGRVLVFRLTGASILHLFAVGTFQLIWISGLFVAWDDDGGRPELTQQLALAPLVVLTALLMHRIWRLGLYADDEAVVVRNLLRTRRMRWTDIVGIDPPPPYGVRWRDGLTFTLTDGQVVAATITANGPFTKPDRFTPVVEDLRARLAASRPG